MYSLYVLRSLDRDWHYIGITANLKNRLAEHNNGEVRSTKAHRPLRIIHTETFFEKTAARKRELFLKKNAMARQDLLNGVNAPIV